MDSPILRPQTTNTPPLPSFASIRSRNLATLYEIGTDKSSKGFIDAKIAPLCHLINHHNEYVTTSSCSGRVALFDPGTVNTNDDENIEVTEKFTKLSGKGRGQWRFVTHDLLPDLGSRLVTALAEAVRERQLAKETSNCRSMLTLKYEPPLLHIAAASLPAGQKILKVFKSVCRESGLMVTDERVTVEIRTMGTALCIPIFISADNHCDGKQEFESSPSQEYLMNLAQVINERLVQNEALLARLYKAVKAELFIGDVQKYINDDEYEVQLELLPDLNLWKTASVALTSGRGDDVDLITFGGQGIGPNNTTTCQRWDKVFMLKRRDKVWTDSWDGIEMLHPSDALLSSTRENGLMTNAGTFQVEILESLGRREGHSACILSPLPSNNYPSVVAIFGGRAGGPLSPTNDLFLFILRDNNSNKASGVICKPDTRGSAPNARFGHTMTSLGTCHHCKQHVEGEPLALIAGGTGIGNDGHNQALSSVYILSRCGDNNSDALHLLWERLADMQVPRAYHAHVRASVESCSNCVLIFGGVSQSDDPFGDTYDETRPPDCELLSCEDDKSYPAMQHHLPSLLGGVAGVVSPATFLVAGGINTHTEVPKACKQHTLRVFRWGFGGRTIKPARTNIKLSVATCNDQQDIDLGVFVHHCLAPLQTFSEEAASSGVEASFVLVGGGVPTFSFGQSYSKSYAITLSYQHNAAFAAPVSITEHHTKVKQTRENQTPHSLETETDVAYVSKQDAKKVKVELESLGYLDKRFKMIQAVNDKTLIALPITDKCLSYLQTMNKDQPQYLFEEIVVNIGKETVPLSSSSLAKLKQHK